MNYLTDIYANSSKHRMANARNLGISEAQLLKDYPTLSATDLANAWVYATVYPEEIATAIRENEQE
ncbi:MAG: DUF433 domain-containing protein [Richelia sp. RM2_1_2]|nr:DUF433 domain-containing protein [Richelia sp. SM1_7_0]NJN08726.1 DUF433 domain-containing protein [Richelia sp. RM1_1_1]NJO27652.1 DUF433 domain-containing protein [Richelia sp. SL_2_1]NJO59256.1 DUF433 domain-containing protein [Richelia sp. RM2_1_2]NJS16282.1 DUF433 domain-containing protein [Nostocaceae cyanobacterium CSU_2_110]